VTPVKTLLLLAIKKQLESIDTIKTVLLNPPSGTSWDACEHPLCITSDMTESFKLVQDKSENTFRLQIELYTIIDSTLDNITIIDDLYSSIIYNLQLRRDNTIWDYAKKVNPVSASRIFGYDDYNGYLMEFDIVYLTVRGNPYTLIL